MFDIMHNKLLYYISSILSMCIYIYIVTVPLNTAGCHVKSAVTKGDYSYLFILFLLNIITKNDPITW